MTCKGCNGEGRKAYASTATWRGGIGGQMITEDVCDTCWGSGDKTKPGRNLRELSRHKMDCGLNKGGPVCDCPRGQKRG